MPSTTTATLAAAVPGVHVKLHELMEPGAMYAGHPGSRVQAPPVPLRVILVTLPPWCALTANTPYTGVTASASSWRSRPTDQARVLGGCMVPVWLIVLRKRARARQLGGGGKAR